MGMDADSGDIVTSDLIDKDVDDVTVLPGLLDQVKGRIDRFLGDGAYCATSDQMKPARRRAIRAYVQFPQRD